jgi:uncharacterized protein (DUF1697 family)
MADRPRAKGLGVAGYVALLRGINVGGKHLVPMEELRGLAVEAGCREVRTYIQSGNLVLVADAATAGALPERLGAALARRFGFEVPVVVRSAAQLQRVVEASPFVGRGCDPDQLYVAFLAGKPGAAAARRLDPQRSPGDSFALVGSEVHLHLPNGAARTRLTNAWLDAALETVSTARNWRTVLKLIELVQER